MAMTYDILIIGSGNAGFSAAVSAAQHTPSLSILLIDACPQDWAGGNTYFTAGAFRTTHSGLSDLLPLVNNVNDEEAEKIDLPAYTAQDFTEDLQRVTEGRSDPELAKALVGDSRETLRWLREVVGVRFQLSFNRQAYRDEKTGRWRFWGGLCLKTQDGGKGLVADHMAAAHRHGIAVQFNTKAKEIVRRNGRTGAVTGVKVARDGKEEVINCNAVILAAGGFEASPELRAHYLGKGWEKAHVRGTPYNTGTLLTHCITSPSINAKARGDFSPTGCHSVAWDFASSRSSGNRVVSNEYTKSGYPLGIMLNVEGRRFVDEGVDFRNYTYAKFGRAILEQPDGVAFQVYDRKGAELLREEEYREEVVERITAGSIVELAEKCAEKGLEDRSRFVNTVLEYNTAVYANRACYPDSEFNPAVKDGWSTESPYHHLKIPKSNWALAIDEPNFLAIKVTCGITFTFGGLGVDPKTAGVICQEDRVQKGGEKVIEGLYCIGEMMGGLFWGNYPGGSGLTSGAIFGRKAGRAAAEMVGCSKE